MKFRFSAVLFCLIFFNQIGTAQDTIQTRPRIGLALSGGAAHGLAHIGVIKYLEELGIEADLVTGTSMGSVVGGLDAMGFNAEEIRNVAAAQNWDLVMSNHTPLYEVAPIEKRAHEKIPLSIFWKNEAFRLPQGFIRGQKLDLIISQIYCPAYFIDDFDDLYMPFRCVAVDIEDGSIDVLDHGYIGESIRASMAIPSVFPPKEIDNNLYVDGGLRRNFPVTEAQDLGADFVIGVYVGSEKSDRSELNSMLEVLKQSASMSNILDSEEQAKLADIVVYPDVKDMNTFSFNEYEKFIQLGYEAARKQEKAFKGLAKKLQNFKQPTKGEKLHYPQAIRINEIYTSETDPTVHRMIVNELKFDENQMVTLKELEESLALVYGTKNFSKASYAFEVLEDGTAIHIDTEQVDPYTIGISLNRFKRYNASLILTGEMRNKIGQLSNLRIDTRISENPGVQANYHIRIPKSPDFVFKIGGKLEQFEQPFFNNNVIDRLYSYRVGTGLVSINKEWRNASIFSLEYLFNYDFLKPVVFKTDDFAKYRTRKHKLQLAYSHNTLDRTVFPETGLYIASNLGLVLSNDFKRTNHAEGNNFLNFDEVYQYPYFDLDIGYFHHSTTLFCSEFYLKGRLSSGGSFLDNYKVGGPLQEKQYVYGFTGIEDSELLMGDHISLKYALRFHASSSLYLSPVVQYIYGDNYLSRAYDIEDVISTFGYGIQAGLNSPIGPIVLDVGYSGLRDNIVINLGFGFRHLY